MNSYFLVLALIQLSLVNTCFGARKLTSLYNPPPMALTYHGGALLEGDLYLSILWYGKFSPAQKSIVVDFILSINSHPRQGEKGLLTSTKTPAVSQWWQTIDTYMKKAGKNHPRGFSQSNNG